MGHRRKIREALEEPGSVRLVVPDPTEYRSRLIRSAEGRLQAVALAVCAEASHREVETYFAADGTTRPLLPPDNSVRGRCLSCGLAVKSQWDPPLPTWYTPRVTAIEPVAFSQFVHEALGWRSEVLVGLRPVDEVPV
jgi:hypothetical protein